MCPPPLPAQHSASQHSSRSGAGGGGGGGSLLHTPGSQVSSASGYSTSLIDQRRQRVLRKAERARAVASDRADVRDVVTLDAAGCLCTRSSADPVWLHVCLRVCVTTYGWMQGAPETPKKGTRSKKGTPAPVPTGRARAGSAPLVRVFGFPAPPPPRPTPQCNKVAY